MLLADLIADAVARPGYGGGLSREELARMMRRDPYDKFFGWALSFAYRNHKIDFCEGYVVQPPPRFVSTAGLEAWLSVDPVPLQEAKPPWQVM